MTLLDWQPWLNTVLTVVKDDRWLSRQSADPAAKGSGGAPAICS